MALQVVPPDETELVVPPHDPIAERAVAGALMLEPGAITRVMDFLRPEDFYGPACRVIYAAATTLFGRQEPIDSATLGAELERTGMLGRVGSRAALAQIQNAVPTAANIEHYGRVVKDLSRERQLIEAGHAAVRLGYDRSLSTDDKISQAGAQLLGVAMDSPQRGVPIGEILKGYPALLDARQAGGGKPVGIPSGLYDLDRLTGGWEPGKLILVGGRSSMGKTAAAVQFVRHAAVQEGRAVLVFSLEMSRLEIVERLLANQARVSCDRLHRGDLGDDELKRVFEAMGQIGSASITIDDRAALDEFQVSAEARRVAQELGGLGLVVVDYIGLMTGRQTTERKDLEVGNITRSLKALAKTLECPVIALAQLNRNPEARTDKRPQLSDLRDSGALEHDADQVVFVFRPGYYDKADTTGTVEFIVAKNRNAAPGTATALFRGSCMAFDSLEQRRGGLA